MFEDLFIPVLIDDLAFGGDGVGTVLSDVKAMGKEETAGMRCFIPFTLPGEEVRASIVVKKPRYLKAEALDLVNPSPDRVLPKCSLFGICGGCSWQHIDYQRQVKAKENILRQNLRRIGGFEAGEIRLFPSPDSYAYRRRARFRVNSSGKLSFIGRDGKTLIPLQSCPVLHPELEKLLANSYSTTDREMLAQVEEDGQLATYHKPDDAPFIQANKGMNALLQEQLCIAMDRYIGSSRGTAQILDLYCGNGNLSLPLLQGGYRVHGFDTSKRAIEEANYRAKGTGSSPGGADPPYRIGDALKDAIRYLESGNKGPENLILIIDPPRKGMGAQGATKIASLGAKAIFYISCDPASLSRDFSYLSAEGYRSAGVTLFDMFPQTSHLETLLILEKGGGEL